MSDLSVSRIENINTSVIREILTSNKISDNDKIQFIRKNDVQIQSVLETVPTNAEYSRIMENRPLIKFKPIRNSFTKRGDKILLAKALNIPPSDVNDYIKNVHNSLHKLNKLDFLPTKTVDLIKTYIYRHGTAEELVSFFNFELANTKNILKTLYSTLEYHNGGVADYFIRPIHRMSNKTLVSMYKVVDDNLKLAESNGQITEKQNLEISEWAIKRIYQIQHNSKFINAIRAEQTL